MCWCFVVVAGLLLVVAVVDVAAAASTTAAAATAAATTVKDLFDVMEGMFAERYAGGITSRQPPLLFRVFRVISSQSSRSGFSCMIEFLNALTQG